jgi:hypothetical protein
MKYIGLRRFLGTSDGVLKPEYFDFILILLLLASFKEKTVAYFILFYFILFYFIFLIVLLKLYCCAKPPREVAAFLLCIPSSLWTMKAKQERKPTIYYLRETGWLNPNFSAKR